LDFKLHLQQENAQHSDETQEQVIDAEHSDDSFGKTDVCQVFDDETLEIEGIEKPELQQVDWLRRGQLCERLGRVEDAERAYRVCTYTDANFTAW